MAKLLSDNNTYRNVSRDPPLSYKKKVIDCLQQLENEERKPVTAHPPTVFILVKLYLAHMTSNIKSVTYNIKKLHPTHLAENTPYHVPNSNNFTNRVLKLNWPETK